MTVTRVNREGGNGPLVLSSQDHLASVSALQAAERGPFHSYSGLRVPREAVCYSEETGSPGYICPEGAKAVWKAHSAAV